MSTIRFGTTGWLSKAAASAFLACAASACVADVTPNQKQNPDGGGGPQTTRCDGIAKTCGVTRDVDCCATDLVSGGDYSRANMDTMMHPEARAHVSDFKLDRFEVTVGRFKKFFAGYPGNKPAAGAGKHPFIDGSGWNAAWNAHLPADQAGLTSMLKCADTGYQEWSRNDDNLPVNCVNWYVAFAFCISDGGRLPTSAEWGYAASNGDEQRMYPWGSGGPDGYAVFNSCVTTSATCPPPEVGSIPQGNGKFGSADLAGSLFEWVLDWFGGYQNACTMDCAQTTTADEKVGREARGGDYSHDASEVANSFRIAFDPAVPQGYNGFRCARSP
jgi:formylglycine-generating enzyme required for sulfatase activity